MADTVDYASPEITADYRYRRYTWKEKLQPASQGVAILHSLSGLVNPKVRPGHIRRFVSYNTFEADWTPLPPQAKSQKLDPDEIARTWCSRGKTPLRQGNPEYAAVLENVARNNADQVAAYRTRDNWSRPFLVYLCPRDGAVRAIVYVDEDLVDNSRYYVVPDDGPCLWAYITRVYETVARKAFVGQSPLNEMTALSGGHGPAFDGNSILIELASAGQYVFVGDRILRFAPASPITDFASPMGNWDTPYPYAVDAQKNYYLFAEMVLVQFRMAAEPAVNADAPDDPYALHYGLVHPAGLGIIRYPLEGVEVYPRPF